MLFAFSPVSEVGETREAGAKDRFEIFSVFASQGKVVFEVVFDLLF